VTSHLPADFGLTKEGVCDSSLLHGRGFHHNEREISRFTKRMQDRGNNFSLVAGFGDQNPANWRVAVVRRTKTCS